MEARIENFSTWIAYSEDQTLREEVEELLKQAGFMLLNFMDHAFEPQGYTSIWLLAESHCALHTFPEEKKAYIELSSCNIQMFVDFVSLFHKKYHAIQ